ncbi:MAG: hypothetical protein BWX77_00856 [Bacteroidetes bacterium ADurb.Bin090]|nr:MAG: hypothetical protein BWX77_00856 [Bacteroidetes bacterium ADurb.Bin090]
MTSFVDFQVDVHRIVVEAVNGIFYNDGIAVSVFVVFFDQGDFVVQVFGIDKFFGSEKVDQLVFFVGLFHGPLDFSIGKSLVTFDNQLINLDFILFINIDINDDLILGFRIVALQYIDIGIFVAFAVVVFFDQYFCSVDDIGGNLIAHNHIQAGFKFLNLGFLHPIVIDFRNSGPGAENNAEPYFVAFYFVRYYFDIRKKAVPPKAFYGFAGFASGDSYYLADRQSG